MFSSKKSESPGQFKKSGQLPTSGANSQTGAQTEDLSDIKTDSNSVSGC